MTIPTYDELRDFAIARLRKKRELQAHLIAYATVNPVPHRDLVRHHARRILLADVPLLGWGIGLIFHVWDVVSPEAFSEDRIQRRCGG
jgi:hypothetical protein